MAEQIPGLTPELADAARDVLALVRTQLNGDREGQEAIIGPLDLERAKWLLRMTADLAGSLVRISAGDRAEEYLANFAREYLA
jgi:hypothetical protein